MAVCNNGTYLILISHFSQGTTTKEVSDRVNKPIVVPLIWLLPHVVLCYINPKKEAERLTSAPSLAFDLCILRICVLGGQIACTFIRWRRRLR
jgi:hypothetical protein